MERPKKYIDVNLKELFYSIKHFEKVKKEGLIFRIRYVKCEDPFPFIFERAKEVLK